MSMSDVPATPPGSRPPPPPPPPPPSPPATTPPAAGAPPTDAPVADAPVATGTTAAVPVAGAPGADDRPDATVAEAGRTAHAILDEVERAVVGKRQAITLVLAGLLADGHVLLDDLPGVAKTLTARSIATAAGLGFARVQFTPDLLPSDITGSLVLDLATQRPEFRPGPVFTDLLLADEINRAPAKTQAALLEAMQERQVTVDGVARPLPRPFLVIATQNPIESEGTYPLPEAQLDRFALRASMGYPSPTDEVALLAARVARGTDDVELRPVCDAARFVEVQQALERVFVDPRLLEYAVALVGATRADGNLSVGASPRGSLALVKLARAWALLDRRDYVGPDDIRTVAIPALAHRVVVTDETWARGTPASDLVRRVLDRVPAPSVS
jgi:MoxR-like ATPase